MHSYLPGSQRSVYKVTPHNKVWFVIMLSKHSRQSSLRASLNSLRLLFESPQSVRSLSGYGSSTPLMSQRAGAISAGGRTDDSNDPREDILGFESEDSISVCESKDTVSIDESKDVASKSSDLPEVFEDKTEKNGISGADTESVAGNCESKNDIIILSFETKEHCICECSGPLGMEGGIISNQQVTASSTHRALFGLQKWFPYFARLNKKGLVNAWSAAEGDRYPWIQINLQQRMRVTGLITQGAKRIGSPEYVKSYKVAYSDDGKAWSMFKVKDTDEDMIFTGNTDNNAPSANSFSPPIEAQYIRVYPQVCRKHCTLRMELLGCELTGCSEPMGMKTGHIQDYQITSSSVFQTLNMDMFSWEPSKARLDKQGKVNAWTSAHNDQSQWLQVDLLITTKITGIITQGAKDFGHVQFVGSFKLAFSNDGEKWLVYQDEKQQKDKVIVRNRWSLSHKLSEGHDIGISCEKC
ncbi:EGF-like repeat and discoidin I-like domain-containing protein 3 isoform X2 [Megalobrama amblycephala]|uniref:EGF-like repeat and discoidin I-like domain-containing protein 3 isoform X2 n=1 Tax=Megalobrama amblycephala TaxID=75352 RepID=UPI00201403A2|nr:EGF-like repeat and discoidin I-like domain-containing protein 3 isoform X2 [Megalobrama amblycephala]